MSLGGATAPLAYSPGGTVTQTTPFNWGNLLSSGIQGGATVGAAALT